MNGLYAQAQLQQQAMNAIKNYNDTTITRIKPHVVKLNPPKVYKPKLDSAPKFQWNNSAPIASPSEPKTTVGVIEPQNIHSTSSTTTTSNTSSNSSSILTTIESDFSNYSTYIILGGIAILVFFMFSGSSSKPTKYVDVKIPES